MARALPRPGPGRAARLRLRRARRSPRPPIPSWRWRCGAAFPTRSRGRLLRDLGATEARGLPAGAQPGRPLITPGERRPGRRGRRSARRWPRPGSPAEPGEGPWSLRVEDRASLFDSAAAPGRPRRGAGRVEPAGGGGCAAAKREAVARPLRRERREVAGAGRAGRRGHRLGRERAPPRPSCRGGPAAPGLGSRSCRGSSRRASSTACWWTRRAAGRGRSPGSRTPAGASTTRRWPGSRRPRREVLRVGARRWSGPRGALVFATCSVFREEGEEVVEPFLAENPGFRLVVRGAALAASGPRARASTWRGSSGGRRRARPGGEPA